jgi:hypothetical protein
MPNQPHVYVVHYTRHRDDAPWGVAGAFTEALAAEAPSFVLRSYCLYAGRRPAAIDDDAFLVVACVVMTTACNHRAYHYLQRLLRTTIFRWTTGQRVQGRLSIRRCTRYNATPTYNFVDAVVRLLADSAVAPTDDGVQYSHPLQRRWIPLPAPHVATLHISATAPILITHDVGAHEATHDMDTAYAQALPRISHF